MGFLAQENKCANAGSTREKVLGVVAPGYGPLARRVERRGITRPGAIKVYLESPATANCTALLSTLVAIEGYWRARTSVANCNSK